MAVDSYSGNYSELVEEQNYMGAFDVKSFPILKRSVGVCLEEFATTVIDII